MNPRQSKDYWNKRVRQSTDLKAMVFADNRFDEFNRRTREALKPYQDKKVLDVGCGYGRVSDMFENYLGIDPSEEMIKLAKELHPDKKFEIGDVGSKYSGFDVAFAVMCLSSFGISAEEFAQRFDAPIVLVIEPEEIKVFKK